MIKVLLVTVITLTNGVTYTFTTKTNSMDECYQTARSYIIQLQNDKRIKTMSVECNER